MAHPLLQTNIGVVGAAGKMGRGIALLLLLEMAQQEADRFAALGRQRQALVLIDSGQEGLEQLQSYLKEQLQKYAEKNIIALRKSFATNPALISNKEIIDYFTAGGMEITAISTHLGAMQNVTWVFEAISEDVDGKIALFRQIDALCPQEPLFFTNTSAIPISVLNEGAKLNGRIIGFHFYNPPPVQTVLELIPLDGGDSALTSLALSLGATLNKHCVFSHDIAGFIGNGYLLREVQAGCSIVKNLQRQGFSLEDSVALVDQASGEFCLRPMGLFQLVEYVGFELLLKIGRIMSTYNAAPFVDSEFEAFLRLCRPYFNHSKTLHPLLGPYPEMHFPWKKLVNDVDKAKKISNYLQQLYQTRSTGAMIARELLNETAQIAQQLVESHVALSLADVDVILQEGFYHLYPSQEPLCYGKL